MSREKILQECANIEYKKAEIRNPYPMKESSITDKTKFYLLIKSHMHKTDECVHLDEICRRYLKEIQDEQL